MFHKNACWMLLAGLVLATTSIDAWAADNASHPSATASPASLAAELPNPYPRPLLVGREVRKWDFASAAEGWRALHDCRIAASGGLLQITSTGTDPYLETKIQQPGGSLVLRVRMKAAASGDGQWFWRTSTTRGEKVPPNKHFPILHDGQWHVYETLIDVGGDMESLRLDPGTAPGTIEVDWIAMHQGGLHPLEIAALNQTEQGVLATVKNHDARAITAQVNGRSTALPAGAATSVLVEAAGKGPLEAVAVRVEAEGLPAVVRTVWRVRPERPSDCVVRREGEVTIEAARDGSAVRLLRDGQLLALIAPLVHADYKLPRLQLLSTKDGGPIQWQGEGLHASLSLTAEGELRIAIQCDRPIEGPVVRSLGSLEQGLLAGVEYLGKGECSSSKLDIETDEHLRVEPDPMKLTVPLMATVTDRGSVALGWDDMTLQPVFAAPDFLDGTAGQRMALRGSRIEAVLRLGPGWGEGGRLEEAILWAVGRRGLPDLPPAPRSFDQQMALCLAAYQGMVHDAEHGGWFHAVVPGDRRNPDQGAWFADCASATWRITGQMPEVPKLQLGGAHLRNSASYFVSGRAADWLAVTRRQAEGLIRGQQPDGSYHYGGEYRRGHFEDTASGMCAQPAWELLQQAYLTGDPAALSAGLKTLAYMKRFRTPRGAQTWECPLHTPDILASAHLVRAYVRGYELTGDRQWLDEARRWAITGVPFVYQWSNRPIMLYATTPVLGATHWVAPNWIGLPVQWCGTVYAHGLLLLAPYDTTLDWRKLAEGILICGEQMQYPDGPSAGCLPDVFHLQSQSRRPADINPGALVSLRLLVSGKPDGLARAKVAGHTLVAPFPIDVRDGRPHVRSLPGVKYQAIIDGTKIVDLQGQGDDLIPLD